MSDQQAPAGWYPTPDGRQRYWSGTSWTDNFAPAPRPAVPPPQPPKKGNALKWVLVGVAATFVLMAGSCIALVASVGNDESEVASAPTASSSSSSEGRTEETSGPASSTPEETTEEALDEQSLPTMGSKVRDGKFEFTVTGLACGITEVGNEYFNTQAQGEFCRLSLTITNIGDEPQTMFADNQDAYDAKGRRFSPDTKASIYDEDSQVLWEEINPGNTVKGKVYYDVPEGTELVTVELHDSAFSGGVEVALEK